MPTRCLPWSASLIATALGLSFALQAASQEKAQPQRPGEIAFSVHTWKGDYFSKDVPGGVLTTPTLGALYNIAGDGRGQRQIVPSGKGVDFPTYSPDGQWLYFQSRTSGQSQVYRCKPDGTGMTRLTASEKLGKEWKDAFGYALSRDGRKMVYTVDNGSSLRIVLANADGSEPRFVAPHLGHVYMAALSPNGDRVVFSGAANNYRLRLVKVPDGKPVDLTPHHPQSFVPRFTPDGRTIVFFRRDGDVYSVGADGKNLRRLTKGNGYVEFRLSDKDQHGSSDGPDISPDGKRIAYIAVKGGVPNVCTMKLDGSEQRQITFRKSRCGRVRWSPDGKRLGFVSFEGRFPQLFVVDAAGGAPRQLTKLEGAVYFLAWRPAKMGGGS